MTPNCGDLIGPWRLERELGSGGFGAVFRAEHQTTRRVAAVKVMLAQLAGSLEMQARFDREIDVLMRLRHPNVVQILDAGLDRAGRPYLAMELLEGRDLGAILVERGRLEPAAAVEILEPLCDALGAAHALGVVHRDVKAGNVFMCESGRVVLLDFGIAKLNDALGPELTASNQALGTPSTMSPEQIRGERVDGRADIYALGCLLFQLLSGELPLFDESPVMTQYLHLHGRRPRASAVAPVAPQLDDVIARAMAIDPAGRYAEPSALIAALRTAARESPALAVAAQTECMALLVSATARASAAGLDETLLVDLEAVLPLAERFLATRGFTLAIDLGSSAVFIAPVAAHDPVAAALAVWEHLAARPHVHARVAVGICVNRGVPSELLRPATWGIPHPVEGVWLSSAIDPASPYGRHLR